MKNKAEIKPYKKELFEVKNLQEHDKQIEIHSYLEKYSPKELETRVFTALKKEENPTYYKIYLLQLGLTEKATNDEIKIALEIHIKNYQERVNELQKNILDYLNKIHTWLKKENFVVKQKPEDIPICVNDQILVLGIESGFPKTTDELFNSELNIIFLSGKYGGNIAVHEYMHGMSHNLISKEIGFKHFENGQIKGNQWLDEGVTIMAELASYPTKEVNKRDLPDEVYEQGYLWLTRLYLRELNISANELLRAYFGEEPYRSKLEEKNQKRFQCGIEELNDLFLGFNKETQQLMVKIIKGESVVLEAIKGTGIDEKYKRLQKIFPNINLIIQSQPSFGSN